ncbi:MAG: hypothetical protein ABIQ57_12340 [Candidatus Kapaibacterium sp.]
MVGIFGNTLGGFSLRYEHYFSESFNVMGGIGGYGTTTGGDSLTNEGRFFFVLTIPIMANYLIRFGDHNVEIGAGMFLHFSPPDCTELPFGNKLTCSLLKGTGTLGYRYRPIEGGFNFGVAYTPIFDRGDFVNWFGIALGHGFR